MEDATDFSWEDGDRRGQIRRAHMQKHVGSNKQIWGKSDTKKPWFCKNFQTNSCSHSKDHETNGHLRRHICAFCLTIGNNWGMWRRIV